MINAVNSTNTGSPPNIGSPAPSGNMGGNNVVPTPPYPSANEPNSISPKKTNKRKSHMSPKMVLGGLLMLLLVVGGVAGFVLMNQSQDTRNQAWVPGDAYPCTGPEQCPANYQCVSGFCEPAGGGGCTPGHRTWSDAANSGAGGCEFH